MIPANFVDELPPTARHTGCASFRMARMAIWCVALLLVLSSCGRQPRGRDERPPEPTPVATTGASSGRASVHIVFSNVHLHAGSGAVLEVRRLEGSLVSTRAGEPAFFDDQRSFRLEIDTGEIAITPASLTRLLNANVFSFEGSPLTDVEVTIEDGHLKQKGTLRKGVAVPVSMTADMSATDDGRVRIHPIGMTAAGIPSGGIMKTFGLELDDLMDSHRTRGFEIVDDDILLSTDRLVPAPVIKGRLTDIRIVGDRIVQVFGDSRRRSSTTQSRNSMQYRGGVLRFGKLTMTDTDLDLIDADPRDPFDFYPAQYVRQLVAGYSKNTPQGGLRVYMPDYDELRGTDLEPAR
jgi:hypothetical protein